MKLHLVLMILSKGKSTHCLHRLNGLLKTRLSFCDDLVITEVLSPIVVDSHCSPLVKLTKLAPGIYKISNLSTDGSDDCKHSSGLA